MTVLVMAVLCAVIGAGVLYWLVFTTEGAYLGPRAVTYLYDKGASSYDRVKAFDPVDDAWDLARPLLSTLKSARNPLVLDVATGTGRLPLALLRCLDFEGSIVGLDLSLRMLEEARRKTAGQEGRVTLVWKDGLVLPFSDETFDAVCCVEALEFMARPREALRQMVRVLRPGGTLLATNRVGLDALLMPGRSFSTQQLKGLLASLSLTEVEIKRWQTYYDLVWAKKEGDLVPGKTAGELRAALRCPQCCEAPLAFAPAAVTCRGCGERYPIERGVIMLERFNGK
jgi:ubiquinone/menaquinone biosynthesis C-methylase UbiE